MSKQLRQPAAGDTVATIKNWLPFVFGPAFAMHSAPLRLW